MKIGEIRNKLLSTRGLFLIILAITIYLRLINILSEQIWHDEGGTILYVNSSFSYFIKSIIRETHPPLYFALLKLWVLMFGDSILACRLLSVIFSVSTMPIMFLIGKELKNEKLGLTIIFFYALSPFSIWYANEIRMYSLLHLLFSLDVLFTIKSIKNPENFKNYLIISIISTLLLYTHYMALIYDSSVFISLFIFNRKKPNFFKYSLISILIILFSYIPWIPYAIEDILGGPAGYTGGQLTLINLGYWFFCFLVAPVPSYIDNPYVFNLIVLSILINIPLLILSLISFIKFIRKNIIEKNNSEIKLFLNFIGVITVLFFGIQILFGFLFQNSFQAKNLIGGLSFINIINGYGLYYLLFEKHDNSQKLKYLKFIKKIDPIVIKKLFSIFFIILFSFSLVINPIFKEVYPQKEDWKGCVIKLKAKFKDGDIVVNHYGTKELPDVMKYYCDKLHFDFSENTYELVYEEEEIQEFIEYLGKKGITRVWIVSYWQELTDPKEKTEKNLIDQYNMTKINDYNFRYDIELNLYEIS